MDRELYAAAQSGDLTVMESFSDDFYSQYTPVRNTVLHVLAQSCDSAEAVQFILAKDSRLLMTKNKRAETALHLAARMGHLGVVRALIAYAKSEAGCWFLQCFDRCKRMLTIVDVDGKTALHEAVTNNLRLLNCWFKDIRGLQYRISYPMKETSLYLAVEKGYQEIVDLYLLLCMFGKFQQ